MMFYALLFIAVLLLTLQAVVFCIYSVHRDWCVERAVCGGCDSPASFFVEAFVGVLVTAAFTILFAGIIMAMATPFIMLVLGPLGLYGWHKMRQHARREEFEKREVEVQFPVARLQFRIPDLWAASVAFGLVMMALVGLMSKDARTANAAGIAALAVYALGVEMGAFLIAMDIFRRSEALRQPVLRALYTIVLMILAAIPPLSVLLFVAWGGWRYGLWKARAARLSVEKRHAWLMERIAERKAQLKIEMDAHQAAVLESNAVPLTPDP